MRKVLYALENLGIVQLEREKKDKAFYDYGWKLTNKGQNFIDKYPFLNSLLKSRKLKEFYEEIKKLLGK
ncbi:hypothetical protein HYT91_00980 [Candidatus Pacearchaeota archaeon]|nr:hypothetical protein [Candidatus Pacearchaeota archaeon]